MFWGVLVAARRPGPGGMNVRHVLHAPLLGDKNTCCRCGAPRYSGVATTVRGARVVGRAREACTKVEWPREWEACGSLAQMAVIKHTQPRRRFPRTERGHLVRAGLKVEGEAIPGAELVDKTRAPTATRTATDTAETLGQQWKHRTTKLQRDSSGTDTDPERREKGETHKQEKSLHADHRVKKARTHRIPWNRVC